MSQDSGVAIKDGAVDLAKLAKENPLVVLSGLWEGVKDLPQSVIDGFVESGKSIGEGAAASFNEDITNKLNTIYGQDVHTAQTTLLAIRTLLAILPAGATAKAGGKLTEAAAEAISKKLDEVIERLAEQKLVKDGAKAIDDSASYGKWWDDLAQPKNLTDREARAWYLSKEAEIPARINSSASLEEQAKQAFNMRNDLRSTARELMSNRTLADSLKKTDPNRTWSEIVNKYSGQGLSEDELWSKIIEKSQSSRTSVNDGLGM